MTNNIPIIRIKTKYGSYLLHQLIAFIAINSLKKMKKKQNYHNL